jgi:hypothetical protein
MEPGDTHREDREFTEEVEGRELEEGVDLKQYTLPVWYTGEEPVLSNPPPIVSDKKKFFSDRWREAWPDDFKVQPNEAQKRG